MTGLAGRAAGAALLGAIAGAAWLSLFYGVRPALEVDFATTPPRLVSGVYPAERDPGSGLTFAWTGPEMAVRLPGIDRHVDWTFHLRVRGARAVPAENPGMTFYADGLQLMTQRSAGDFEDVRMTIPARPGRTGLTLLMQVSSTFVPGPGDPRPLGVMLDAMTLSPAGVILPPRRAFAGIATASAAMGAGIALLGVTAGSAVGGTVLVSAGLASLMTRGFGPYTTYPETAARLAVWIAIVMAACAAALQLVRRQPLRNTARFVAAFTASALLLKLVLLLHPDMPIGDAMFHAHRFHDVLGGNLHFTSIAPGNYLFPYAPGLYVFAAPFAGLVRRGAADMSLLRIIVASVDAAVAILLYVIVVRARGDRLAGAIAVAAYHLVPLDLRVLTVGNLTNAFAQSISVIALALLAAAPLRIERWPMVLLFTAVLAFAFMSHTSTFAVLSVSTLVIALIFRWRGGPDPRSAVNAVVLALVAAAMLAVALYYAHFLETYRAEFARIGAETATGAADAGGRGIMDRFAAIPHYLYVHYGIPVIALAAWGAAVLWQQSTRDRLTLVLAGWSLAALAFLALGILTPVDMRYYLAAVPVIAVAAGIGAAAGWSARGGRRIAAIVLLAWTVLDGVTTWRTTLG